MPTPRPTYCSVTNFIHCGDDYLFLHRKLSKKIDPGRLNGVGGKLEPGENYLDAAIRETHEETGLVITPEQVQLAGVARLQYGYPQDWVFCLFRIEVPNKNLPLGTETTDGGLLWLHKDQVLSSGYELVDDLYLLFPKIAAKEPLFFFAGIANDQEKIATHTLSCL